MGKLAPSVGKKLRRKREAVAKTFDRDRGVLSSLVKKDELREYERRDDIDKELLGTHIAEVEVKTFPYLHYVGDRTTCEILECEFQSLNAIQFRPVMKTLCVAGIMWFVIILGAYWEEHSLATKQMYGMLIAVLPLVYWLFASAYYTKFPQRIVLSLFGIAGIGFIANKVIMKDYSNITLTLYVILIFTATPLVFLNAALLCGVMLASFFATGFLHISLLEYHNSTNLEQLGVNVSQLELLGIEDEELMLLNSTQVVSMDQSSMLMLTFTNVVAFFFLLYVTYYRELNLRKGIINHFRLVSKSSEIEIEAEKTHNLLRSMLPDVISEQLRKREEEERPYRIAEKFGSVTIMFVEVCSFNRISSEQTQDEVLDILNTVYSIFDSVLEDYEAYKVETVGQVYLVVGGCPQRSRRHSECIGELALEFMSVVPEINQILRSTLPNLRQEIKIRIGINTGSIVAGVVGQQSPRYKLFGDPVNTASRMQSTCPEGRIQVSINSFKALERTFLLEHRGSITVKGKGEMDTYFLLARRDTIDQGRNAIRDKSEMQQHVAASHNMLFRSFQQEQSSSFLSTSSRRLSKSKVAPTCDSSEISAVHNSDEHDAKESGLSMDMLESTHSSTERMAAKGRRLRSSRWCRCVNLIFSVGSPEYHAGQVQKGLASVTRIAHILLVLLPVALVVEMVILASDNSMFQDIGSWIVGITILTFVLCSVLSVISKYAHMSKYVYIIVEITFLSLSVALIVINVMARHPNSSFMMVELTFFFNLQVVPMSHRFFLTLLVSVCNCAALLFVVQQRARDCEQLYGIDPTVAFDPHGATLEERVNETLCSIMRYKRYTLDDQDYTVNSYDILLHLMLLVLAIILQLWCVVVQDVFLFRDFCHNKLIMGQSGILQKQKAQTTALLSQLLPPSIVPKLVDGGQDGRIVDRFQNVTILFTDMVNFTSFSRQISPLQLMDFLNVMYTRFDAITEKYKLYKVEVIGDAYFIVGGCPIKSEDHTERVVKAAQEMLAVLPELCEVAHKTLKEQQKQRKERLSKERRIRQLSSIDEPKLNLIALPDSPKCKQTEAEAAAADHCDNVGNEASAAVPGAGEKEKEAQQECQGNNNISDKPTNSSLAPSQTDSSSMLGDTLEPTPSALQLSTCDADAADERVMSGINSPLSPTSEWINDDNLDAEIPKPDISIRIGVHVGSVIAGVVGFKDPRYHIFGDAVSLANMMESKGKPGKVHVSQSVVDALMKGPGVKNVFKVEPREPIDMSPIAAPQQTYFLSNAK